MALKKPPAALCVQIPDMLRAAIERSAKANGRSLNDEIVAALGEAMGSAPSPLNKSDMEAVRTLVEDLTRRAFEQARATSNVGYLSVDELGDLVGCKSNQRSKMIAWLTENRWKFEVSSAGVPRVARLYHDRKLGIADGPVTSKFASEPDREAFANRQRGRKAAGT